VQPLVGAPVPVVRPALGLAGGQRHLRRLGVLVAQDDAEPVPELKVPVPHGAPPSFPSYSRRRAGEGPRPSPPPCRAEVRRRQGGPRPRPNLQKTLCRAPPVRTPNGEATP